MYPFSPEEYKAIQASSLVLHAVEMELFNEKFDIRYSGSGSVSQSSSGSLDFILYDANTRLSWRVDRDSVPGRMVEEDDYYTVRLRDSRGRRWTGQVTYPSTQASAHPGLIARGTVRSLTYVSNLDESYIRSRSEANRRSLRMYFHEDVELPVHLSARKREKEDEDRLSIQARIAWDIVTEDYRCTVRRIDHGLELISSFEEGVCVSDGVDLHIEGALWFCLGRLFWWTVLVEHRADEIRCTIREARKSPRPAAHRPPIVLDQPASGDASAMMFSCYLAFTQSHEESGYHSLSVSVQQALTGAAITVETEALGLGIAVEGVVKRELKSLALPTAREAKLMDDLCAFISGWEPRDVEPIGEEHTALRTRLTGTVGAWKGAHVATALRRLQTAAVVSTRELQAWSKNRNEAAHGGFADKDVMRWIERCRSTHVLFYKLVFLVIGYEGPFTDWGAEGWPSATFSVPDDLARFR